MFRGRARFERSALIPLATAAILAAHGCTRKLGIDVELLVPESPDPFEEVRTVRLRALLSGRIALVGEGRWDQGPLDFPTNIEPEVERLLAEGISKDGAVLSSGASVPLDLLHAPPEGPIAIVFSRIGALSVLTTAGARREGGAAVQLPDERVLFLGGATEGGCAIETTEVVEASAAGGRPGPPLPAGRVGDFHALALPDGRVVVAAGESAPGCGARVPARRLSVLDAESNTTVSSKGELEALRPGAATAAVSNTLVIVAGGDDALGGGVSDTIYGFNPRTLEFQAPTKLEKACGTSRAVRTPARSESSAQVIAGQRIVFIGGRSELGDESALDCASIFDPGRGSTSTIAIEVPRTRDRPLGISIIAPATQVSSAGSVIIAGGRDASGAAQPRVLSMVAQSDRAKTFGDVSAVVEFPSPPGPGSLIDLRDGSLIFLPAAGRGGLTWISLLPTRVESMELPFGVEGPLVGGRVVDGTLVLRSVDGSYLVFNPGPSGVLGASGIASRLSGEDASLGGALGAGIIPLRPSAWALLGSELRGRLLETLPLAGIVPDELAVLGPSTFGDFDVTFTFEPRPLAQGAFVFGLSGGEFDHVGFLGGRTIVGGSRIQGEARTPIFCAAATPSLSQPVPHRVRVRRSGDEVRLDTDADGTDELRCATSRADAGLLAFGIIGGEVAFRDLTIDVVR